MVYVRCLGFLYPSTQHLNQVFSRSSKNFLLAKKKDARQRFSSLKDQEINASITAGYTPEDKPLEPENTGPLEKENHSFSGSMLISGVYLCF